MVAVGRALGSAVGSLAGRMGVDKNKDGRSKSGPRATKPSHAPGQPPNPIQEAVIESQRQRQIQKPGLDVAQTILGAMPSNVPLGAALGLGRLMGEQSEKEALSRPGDFDTNPKDPGSVYTKEKVGAAFSNRDRFPGHNPDPGNRTNSESLKKKKQQLPTLLGTSANPTGTFSNPVMIT